MPKYGLEDTPEDTKPKRACEGLRQDLKECLLWSDCVRKVSNCHTVLQCSKVSFKVELYFCMI